MKFYFNGIKHLNNNFVTWKLNNWSGNWRKDYFFPFFDPNRAQILTQNPHMLIFTNIKWIKNRLHYNQEKVHSSNIMISCKQIIYFLENLNWLCIVKRSPSRFLFVLYSLKKRWNYIHIKIVPHGTSKEIIDNNEKINKKVSKNYK